jgi:hypothetical protein
VDSTDEYNKSANTAHVIKRRDISDFCFVQKIHIKYLLTIPDQQISLVITEQKYSVITELQVTYIVVVNTDKQPEAYFQVVLVLFRCHRTSRMDLNT